MLAPWRRVQLAVRFQMLVRALLCNYLICLGAWLALASSSLPGKATAVFLCISGLGAIGLEHGVANMFSGSLSLMLHSRASVNDFVMNNIVPVTLGNALGGAVRAPLVPPAPVLGA